MKKIDAHPKSLNDLLSGKKYTIHYYQREYRWGRKQIEELLDDLTEEFLEYYDEAHDLRTDIDKYGHYYLGTVVLSEPSDEQAIKDNAIIDGQQRLTSLTLLLIYLNNLQAGRSDRIVVDPLIFSERLTTKSFNIHVKDREACLDALYKGQAFDPDGQPESVQTIYTRYHDIEDLFPEDLKGRALPFFIGWLMYNVDLVEITAKTEQDANKIFVTMNDRGLSLTSAEMLKGYLLSRIKDDHIRNQANDIWKAEIFKLNELGVDEDATFLKSWLRAQFADSIRQSRRGAKPEDYDIISTVFHKWVRQNSKKMGLSQSVDYETFVMRRLPMFGRIYRQIKEASDSIQPGFEAVFFNASRNFTLQPQIILSAIDPDDDPDTVAAKIRAVSTFLDQYISIRVFNFKVVDHATIKNAMFNFAKTIRRLPLDRLLDVLTHEISDMEHTLDGIDGFHLNQFTKRYMLHILARMTHYIESESGRTIRFEDYVRRDIKNPYDIEHIWEDKYEPFADQFENEDLWTRARNSFGALLMLPQDLNRSLQDKPYNDKVKKYYSQNLLAKSLNVQAYENNPQFLRFIDRSGLRFEPVPPPFSLQDIQSRKELYKSICKKIWDPAHIEESVTL